MQPENQDPVTNQSSSSEAPAVQPEATPAPGPVVSAADTTIASPQSPAAGSAASANKSPLKKLLSIPVIAGIAALLLAGGAGAYFGVVVPNKPENIWKKSLSNTSKGLDKLIAYSKQKKDIKGTKLSGNFRGEASGVVADGSFEGKSYEQNSEFKADIGAAGARVNLEILSNVPDGSKNPDIYFKAKGLASIGKVLGSASPEISDSLTSFDNQWYVLDHTALDQIEAMYTKTESEKDKKPELTADDVYAIEDAVNRATKDYLLSTAPDKAVMKVHKSVGKEVIDGRKVFHYEVTFDKGHMKAYVTALKDELKKTKLGELYKEPSFEEAIGFSEMIKSIDELKDDQGIDVWTDTATKLIRKVRFTDKENNKNYLDISMNYNGGSTYPLVFDLHTDEDGEKGVATFKTELDTDKNTVKFDLNVDYTTKYDGPIKVSGTIKAEESNEKVEFKKPEDAKSVYDLLGGYMQGMGGSGVPTGASGADFGNFDL